MAVASRKAKGVLRRAFGWALKPRLTADLATDALTMAWCRRRPTPGVPHHSDRGSQYASGAFQDRLTAYGMTSSMSRKGNCWDNAPTESAYSGESGHPVRRKVATGSDSIRPVSPKESGR